MQQDGDQDFETFLCPLVGDLAYNLVLSDSEGTLAKQQDLDAVTHTGQRLLADEDKVVLSQLAPGSVQDWCLSRMTHYRNHNGALREKYGAAARHAIAKNKSHIRALRTPYNDAAPIHQRLHPEVLMEIFSHIHPAAMCFPWDKPEYAYYPYRWVPVLRVCRYWRRLLFKTARFWANLFSLPTSGQWEVLSNPNRHQSRLRAALMRSGLEDLDLSVPYYSQGIVDILTPHASRLSSLNAGPSAMLVVLDPEQMVHLSPMIEQRLSCVSHPPSNHIDASRTFPLTFSFSLFPNLRSLQLRHSHLHPPAASYISLRNLQLSHCAVRPSSSASHGLTLYAIHDVLPLFPNLETLSLTCCLSDIDAGTGHGLVPSPQLAKTIHLPRLRYLELRDTWNCISRFLSHLVFPPTTSLALWPFHTNEPTIELFAGVDLSWAPHAALHLELGERHRGKHTAFWETRGDGVRPVRVTLDDITLNSQGAISHVTREFGCALIPRAPASAATPRSLGVTSLTIPHSTYMDDSGWKRLLLELPVLRRLRRMTGGYTLDTLQVVGALAERRSESSSGALECPCTHLEELELGWGVPRERPGLPVGWEQGGNGEGLGDRESLRQDLDDGSRESERQTESRLAASLSKICDAFAACLTARAVGYCEPIKKLSVSLHKEFDRPDVRNNLEEWQVALVEQRFRGVLGHWVGDITVSKELS